ncbi:MAG: LamG domain-containing protein [Planctomycetota bacterium]|nr:MAG: LamG domain-containing protein [Planctomycetota bacterium]
MKRLTKIAAILVLLIGAGSAWADLTDGLVAHWKLDEETGLTAYDSAGSSHGTLVNGPIWASGLIDGALEFDNIDDYVNVGDPADESLDFGADESFSITAWIKCDDVGGYSAIVGKRRSTGLYGYFYEGYRFRVHYDTLVFEIEDTGNNGVGMFGTTPVTDNVWHHVAAVRDATANKLYLYVDGNTDGEPVTDTTSGSLSTSQNFWIGLMTTTVSNDPLENPHYFSGLIDDVRIYDRALSAAEIEELYLGEEPELVGLEIAGPDEVAENHQTQYSAIAIYDNNTTADVTHLAKWSVEPNLIASIEAGLLTTEEIFEPHAVTITAEYTEADITEEDAKEVSIFAICPSGNALDFDGDNDYVELGTIDGTDDLALADSSFTICSWIKPDLTGDTWQRIVDKSNGTTGNNGYTFFVHTNGMIGVFIDWNDFRSDGSVITAGIWQHVAVTGDGSDYQLYVEGLPVSGLFLSGSYNSPPGVTTNMRIGMWNHSTAREFNGSIDDVRIYNRALSAEQIWANIHIPLEGDEPNLVACWNFDEGEGQIVYDLSPNANHGQLGSSPDIDNSDPAWVESDAPVGICSPEGLVERNVNEALEIKLNILDEILEALAREDASVNILDDLFGEAQYGHLDKRDIIKAKQEIHSAIQGEEQAIDSLEKSAGDLEDSLEALSGQDGSPESPPERQSKTLTKPAPSDVRKPSRK